jgi:Flp pilus assembly protein TadG
MTMGRRTLRRPGVCECRPSAADERGVALIEFALVLPLLLLLVLGMIDVGKAFNYWNDETHLANEAARFAAVNNSPTKNADGTPTARSLLTAIKSQADSAELRNGGTRSISSPGVSICIWFPSAPSGSAPPASAYQVGQPLQVVVKAQYNWLAYLVGKGLRASSGLTATSTMRIEQPPANPTSATTTDAYVASATNSC